MTSPNGTKTISNSPEFVLTRVLYQCSTILLVNDTSRICLDNVWTFYLHPLVYYRHLIRWPYAKVIIVQRGRSILTRIIITVAGEVRPLRRNSVTTHRRRCSWWCCRQVSSDSSASSCRRSCCLSRRHWPERFCESEVGA